MVGQLIDAIFTIFELLILARVLMSWMRPDPNNQLVRLIYQATEPFLAPIRQFMPRDIMIDFSPMVVLVIAWVLQSLLHQIIRF